MPLLSPAAYQLHLSAITDSVRTDQAGLVTSGYLDSLGPAAAAAVTELVASGCWERGNAGYRILDTVMTQMSTQIVAELRERDARVNWLRVRTEQEEVLIRARKPSPGPDGR